MPILEAGEVNMVLTGHSHIYERSMLIDGAYATPTVADGVVLDDGDGHMHGDGAYQKSAGLHAHQGVAQLVIGHGGQNLPAFNGLDVLRVAQFRSRKSEGSVGESHRGSAERQTTQTHRA